MKIKMISAAIAFLSLILFIPVFVCTILAGNHMNYNEEHKIALLWPNTALFLFGILVLLVLGGLFLLAGKVPCHKYTIIGAVLFCFIFYVVKVEISKCIAFYGGWDCGMVANSARDFFNKQDIGYSDYYAIYTNNVPIAWLLYILYQFSRSLGSYAYNPEFIWIQFQCLMFAFAVFFSAMVVLAVKRRADYALLSLLVGGIFLGLCPWQIIPYTDGSTIAVSVFVVLLYAVFRRTRAWYRYVIWLALIFTGAVGGVVKATCYVSVIAVAAVDFVWLVFEKRRMSEKVKELAIRAVLLSCGFMLAFWCREGMYRTLRFVPEYDKQMTWSNYFYNGLNEETTGACSGDGLIIAQSYADYSRRFRQSVELHYAKDRIVAKGFWGMLDFWLRKQVMNFNDGTFGWYQEGYFNAWEYEEITDSRLKEPLRDFYWEEGDGYLSFNTWSQGIWIFVLSGIVAEAIFVAAAFFQKKACSEELCLRTVMVVIFIGAFLFVMLFEGRSRYLLNNSPIFVTMAALGYGDLFANVRILAKRLASGKRNNV